MGTIINDAIVVTGRRNDVMITRFKARDLGLAVTEVVPHSVNGHCTYLIVPDGSKEGWQESDEADDARDAWKTWVSEQKSVAKHPPYPVQAPIVDWVHVRYGGDFEGASVVDHGGDSSEEFP